MDINIGGIHIADTFTKYGLDAEKNFLIAPRCPNCDEVGYLLLETFEDAVDLAGSLLSEQECCHCAICLVPINNYPSMVIKTTECGETIIFAVYDQNADKPITNLFCDLDAEANFHMLGILVEQEPGEWEVVEI